MKERFLRTDEFEDVVHSLAIISYALDKVAASPPYWKTALIHGHSALQGTCVCLLTRTDGTGALDERIETQMRRKLYGGTGGARHIGNAETPYPTPRLASLEELLKRLPSKFAPTLPGRKAERYKLDADGDIRLLIDLRNEFVHFAPKGWSIELAGLPRVLISTLTLARRISTASEFGRFNRFGELDADRHFAACLAKLADLNNAKSKGLGDFHA